MKITLVLLALLLSGCGMKYDEIKTYEKWCTDRNMAPVYGGFMDRENKLTTVTRVSCEDSRGFRFEVGGRHD